MGAVHTRPHAALIPRSTPGSLGAMRFVHHPPHGVYIEHVVCQFGATAYPQLCP
jgi:hypothetical protein